MGELDERARAVAVALDEGESLRALLLYPPGLDFVAAFFGCLYAGVIAVPSYPPAPSRPGRGQPRLQAILADCAPSVVLTTAALAPRIAALQGEMPALARDFRPLDDHRGAPDAGGDVRGGQQQQERQHLRAPRR